ncbi:MAG: aldehyde dehydrogenase family protein [Clostridiaceae bacterium]|nr:aldehyde dehydrogenase family protein [Clostridiaceae bacterium]
MVCDEVGEIALKIADEKIRFSNFMGAVIDKKSFDTVKGYIEYTSNSPEAEILFGGKCDESIGYFIEPTIIVTNNPHFKTMEEEIFGPVLTVYIYEDEPKSYKRKA